MMDVSGQEDNNPAKAPVSDGGNDMSNFRALRDAQG